MGAKGQQPLPSGPQEFLISAPQLENSAWSKLLIDLQGKQMQCKISVMIAAISVMST